MMSNPNRVLIWMVIFMIAVGLLVTLLFEPLKSAFMVNEIFNGIILAVMGIGILFNLRLVVGLNPDVVWINTYDKTKELPPESYRPYFLNPMIKMFSGRNQRGFFMSALTMRSLLDGIQTRLDESRDISRYMIGLLIFLGLLGTFWGLLDTVVGVGDVISGLSAHGDLAATFEKLTRDLEGPLSGMGTAFSSSLFGLSGSLIVGFFDLQSGHAQNRFYNDLEEWLSELTHLPSATFGSEGERTMSAYIEGLLEQTADSLEKLQRTMSKSEELRRNDIAMQQNLAEKVSLLADQMRSEQKMVSTLAKNQQELQPLMAQLAQLMAQGVSGDEEMRDNMRHIDQSITIMAKEFSIGRELLTDELRDELRLLGHSLSRREQG